MKDVKRELEELGDTLKEYCQKSGYKSLIMGIDVGDGHLYVCAGGRDNHAVMMNLAELTRRITTEFMPELAAQIEERMRQHSGNDVELHDVDKLMMSEFTKVSKLVH